MPAHGYGARRPLVAASGSVAGFEFELPQHPRTPGAPADGPTAAVALAARAIGLFTIIRPTVESGRTALVTLPAQMLGRPAVVAEIPPGTMVALDAGADGSGVPPAPAALRPLVAAARGHGARIGLPLGLAEQGVPFDFVVAGADGGMTAVTAAAQWCRGRRPVATLIATGLANVDEVEQALKLGATFASGRFDATAPQAARHALQPAVQRICQMLGDLAADADTERIAEELRADVTVSYRLLRYVNSPAIGLRHSMDSVAQAVVLLGRGELYRWLSVLLLATGEGRKASRALQEISLARARLLELLARDQGRDPPDALFTIGLLSLMDVMMQTSMAEALEPLHLGEAARGALLDHDGPWFEYLALAADIERHDLASAATRADALGGLDHVLERAAEAWQWAAMVQGVAHEP